MIRFVCVLYIDNVNDTVDEIQKPYELVPDEWYYGVEMEDQKRWEVEDENVATTTSDRTMRILCIWIAKSTFRMVFREIS